ncbi:hypothetical protein OROGR_005199 [Orobanche gracilis]
MQTLDARHIELFLSEGYHDGSWDYDLLGTHDTVRQAHGASGGIFDIRHLKDQSNTGITTIICRIDNIASYISAIFDLKSWVGKRNDWQPRAMLTLNAVAVNTNLQDNKAK